jgi:hypothetical protein
LVVPGAAVRTVVAFGLHAALAARRALARSLSDQSTLGSSATW